MRIGLISSDLSTDNGWATYGLNLIRELRKRDIAATVVCSRNTPPVDFQHYPLLPALTPPERHTFAKSMRQFFAIRRLLRDCDIIHCTAEPYAILAAAVAGARPLFLTAHGSYINLPRIRSFPMNKLYLESFKRARLICVSRYTAQVARELLPHAPIAVINNGVDIDHFLAPPSIKVEKRGPTVVTAGGIKPRKGTLQLIEAIAIAREQLPTVQCLILGSPGFGSAYTDHALRRIDALNLQGNVSILGFVEEELKRAWFAAADVLALPAVNDGFFFEGFGLVLHEAGAAGTAVIGSDGCGIADAIEDGVTGLIVSQERISDELPRALLTLLQDPDRARAMGAAGRQRAKARSWDQVAAQVVQHYERALAESSRD